MNDRVRAELAALVENTRLSEDARRALLDDDGVALLQRLIRQQALQTMVPELLDESCEPVALDQAAPLSGPRSSRLEELGLLGQGGMGEVLRVRDPALGRVMARKSIRSDRQRRPHVLARFIEEAQITAQLTHPGIVPVHELGRLPDGRHYFTMKEVQGKTLGAMIRTVHHVFAKQTEWNVRRLLDAFLRVCEAVAYAHDRGVVHRDIKPANIMLGDFGQVYVMDWGLAKVIGRPDPMGGALGPVATARGSALLTATGKVAGTPAYMPPEQAAGRIAQLGPASDVYSLGAVLFEILAGYPPFHNDDTDALLRQVIAGQRRPLPPDHRIPEGLRAICDRAMALRAADRFPDAEALSVALRRWLEGASRRARALELVHQADALQPHIAALHREAQALHQQAEARMAAVSSWSSEADKAEGWALQDAAMEREQQAALEELSFLEGLQAALKQEPQLTAAHRRLAAHHRRQHAEAEQRRDHRQAALSEARLRVHDRGWHQGYLRGEGSMLLVTDPPGAVATLHRFTRRRRRLVLDGGRPLGTTPLDVPLPMGSYLVTLAAPGRHLVRCPVSIGRQERWHAVPPGAQTARAIVLPPAGSIAPGEVYVPAGWFWSGGDVEAYQSLPRQRVWCEGFVIQQHPVTNAQYLAFLNDLLDSGQEDAALRWAPRERASREGEQGALIYRRGPTGRFALAADADGDIWQPRWPVVMVDWHCAVAYAAWLTARASGEQPPWRLPRGLEREKASRGVDGRFYPWGDFADPSWCCTQRSLPGGPSLVPVDAFPTDSSPYTVRHTAGLVRDWCADPFPAEDAPGQALGAPAAGGKVEVRGGSWSNRLVWSRAALRFGYHPTGRFSDVGIRLVRSLRTAPPPAPLPAPR